MSQKCQGTKSLRSSPLRGSKSRQYDQQAYCWRATHGQQQQEGLRAITPDALSHNDRTGEAMAKLP
jgi:hypothetical protein